MKIVVATRCLNGQQYIERFLKGYSFADVIVVSDGGSTDNSLDMLKANEKVKIFSFEQFEIINGHRWNSDNQHIQHAINSALSFSPDWLILDDLDCWPNRYLRDGSRAIFKVMHPDHHQVNVFRLYLWGEDKYFPAMNKNLDPQYTSLWAWRPDKVNIHADTSVRHGTLVGLSKEVFTITPPMCLLHYSWHPDTIDEKVKRYNDIELPMKHPLEFAGNPEPLPEWAIE